MYKKQSQWSLGPKLKTFKDINSCDLKLQIVIKMLFVKRSVMLGLNFGWKGVGLWYTFL